MTNNTRIANLAVEAISKLFSPDYVSASVIEQPFVARFLAQLIATVSEDSWYDGCMNALRGLKSLADLTKLINLTDNWHNSNGYAIVFSELYF